jgi:hypothetical protein
MLISRELEVKLLTVGLKTVNGNVNANKTTVYDIFTISLTGKDLYL